ncbi:ATP-dependent DNA helicase sgs1, partial [Linderina pennispora]
ERQRQQVRQVVQFCENVADCRRQLVLAYFGEQFDTDRCAGTCDNCRGRHDKQLEQADMTAEAGVLVQSVQRVGQGGTKMTLLQLADIFKGSKARQLVSKGFDQLPAYNRGHTLTKSDAERVCHQLVLRQILEEYCESNAMGYVSSYVRVGRNGGRVLQGQLRVVLQLVRDKKGGRAAKPAKAPKTAKVPKATGPSRTSMSTWLEAPAQPLKSRGRHGRQQSSMASSDDGGDDFAGSGRAMPNVTVFTNNTSKHFRSATNAGAPSSSSIKPMSFRRQ